MSKFTRRVIASELECKEMRESMDADQIDDGGPGPTFGRWVSAEALTRHREAWRIERELEQGK